MIDMMLSRRSIRKFTDEKVSDQDVEKLIKAGLSAPSSMAKYPVELVVTEGKELISALKKCKNRATAALETAPLAITVIADSHLSDVWVEDASIVASYITLEAEKLGLGLNWIQIRLRQGQREDSETEVRRALGIPEKYGVLAILAIGHKAEFPQGYTESDLKMEKVHKEKF